MRLRWPALRRQGAIELARIELRFPGHGTNTAVGLGNLSQCDQQVSGLTVLQQFIEVIGSEVRVIPNTTHWESIFLTASLSKPLNQTTPESLVAYLCH